MISKNRYENIVLKEIQGLSQSELFKVIKTIHFLKQEILMNKKGNVAEILKFAGIWKDIPQNKLDIFSEILKERQKFSEGRSVFG
ncbi:MAG: hypothetical protein ABOK23_13570 [Candidatus Methanoperedens sp.]|nr:hypothetical protein [Candidatus Methanoperedens sp.]MCZ7396290.1 hypothetical protein [Candidatus Methanoperedens sp.]